jgi:hypothetical protein
MTKCYSLLRGRVLRATRLDACGNPVPGSASTVVSEGAVSIALTAVTREGTTIELENANGKLMVQDIPAPQITGFTAVATFLQVDPNLYNLLAGLPLVYDDAATPEAIGFDVNSDIDLSGSGVALELWTNLPSAACAPGQSQQYGYMLLPFMQGGILGDWTWENGGINFQVTNMATKDGSQWGVGPYNVLLDNGGSPSPLLTPVSDKNHLRVFPTSLEPPEPGCGGVPLGTEATGATEVEGGAATLTPPNSYPPANLADAQSGDFVADPLTAWETGSYVVLEDGSHAYWDSDSWEPGEAP